MIKLSCIAAMTIALAFPSSASAASGRSTAPAIACSGSWVVLPTPPSNRDNALLSVDAVSSTDAWAVGWKLDETGVSQPLAEHWDGLQWTEFRSPGASGGAVFASVSMVSGSDIWAVGYLIGDNGTRRTFIEHSTGGVWTQTKSPNVGNTDNVLNSISMDASNDGWAVGDYRDGQHLMLHWNGLGWTVLRFQELGTAGTLSAVTATSTTNAWLVGTHFGHSERLDAWHYNGTAWLVAQVAPNEDSFGAVTSTDSTHAWATISGSRLVEAWSPSVSVRNLKRLTGSLAGIAAGSTDDVWAVGGADSTHWNGSSWREVPIAMAGSAQTLVSVASVAPGDAIAVGSYVDGSGIEQSLAERFC